MPGLQQHHGTLSGCCHLRFTDEEPEAVSAGDSVTGIPLRLLPKGLFMGSQVLMHNVLE